MPGIETNLQIMLFGAAVVLAAFLMGLLFRFAQIDKTSSKIVELVQEMLHNRVEMLQLQQQLCRRSEKTNEMNTAVQR